MIKLNGVKVDRNYFGDGTLHLDLPWFSGRDVPINVEWHYDKDEEMMIWFIAHHLADLGYKYHLTMPYIPHARMDRVHKTNQVFTLKWFAEFLNSLNFDIVQVLDPHSDVSLTLIDRVIINNTQLVNFQRKVVEDLVKPDVIVFPDLGATKRYPWLISNGLAKVTYAEKNRDFDTGKIQDLTLHDPDMVLGARVLIVDDICSYGGTLVRTIKALMEAGAEHVDVCVTHLEDAVLNGELLAQDGLGTIYATDSIFSWNPTGGKVKIIGEEK